MIQLLAFKRQERDLQHLDQLSTAQIVAAVINAAGGHDGKAINPLDLMPDDYDPPKGPLDFDETPEEFETRKAAVFKMQMDARLVAHYRNSKPS